VLDNNNMGVDGVQTMQTLLHNHHVLLSTKVYHTEQNFPVQQSYLLIWAASSSLGFTLTAHPTR
jgi:hypothetical protein